MADRQEIIDMLDKRGFYSRELPSIKWNGSEKGQALCIFHDDTTPSLSVDSNTGGFICFGCNAKGTIFDFYMKKHGVDFREAKQALEKEAGVIPQPHRTIKATYDYTDEAGNLFFQTIRFEPKGFTQRRPNGKGGWIWNLDGIRPLPYNLPKVIESDAVLLVEGEKDVETLRKIGFVASCNPMGAGKWKPEYTGYFQGKKIAILPDSDEAGRHHAMQVARSLYGIAESVKVIELPDLPDKKGADVTDWLLAGGTRERLIEIIETTTELKSEAEAQKPSLLSSLLKWNDILQLDVRTEYLLDRIIPKNSITLMFGRGGIGKTSLMMQIARSIANGLPFDTLETINTPAYYVDFENPLAVLKERVEKIGESDNLYVWHISNEIQPPKLDSTGWELYKQLPPGLIIFDTLRASHLSDENDSKPMSLIMGRLKELREIGFTIILLHHTPRSNDATFKGSGALLDLCDHVLGLEELKDQDGENIEFDCQNLYKLGTRIKTRYEPHSIYLNFKADIKGFSVAIDPDIEKMEGIREILNQSQEPLKQKELRERIKNDLDLPDKEGRKLLRKGTGLYWTTEKGNNNSILFTPLNSVCQFGSTIYTRQTDKQDSLPSETLTNRHHPDNSQTLANTEFGSLSEGTRQTEKPEAIDLTSDDVEIL